MEQEINPGILQGVRGRTFWRSNYHPFIYLDISPQDKHFFSTLAHEATHAIDYIYEYVGEKPGGEVYAICIEAIVHAVEGFAYRLRKVK